MARHAVTKKRNHHFFIDVLFLFIIYFLMYYSNIFFSVTKKVRALDGMVSTVTSNLFRHCFVCFIHNRHIFFFIFFCLPVWMWVILCVCVRCVRDGQHHRTHYFRFCCCDGVVFVYIYNMFENVFVCMCVCLCACVYMCLSHLYFC